MAVIENSFIESERQSAFQRQSQADIPATYKMEDMVVKNVRYEMDPLSLGNVTAHVEVEARQVSRATLTGGETVTIPSLMADMNDLMYKPTSNLQTYATGEAWRQATINANPWLNSQVWSADTGTATFTIKDNVIASTNAPIRIDGTTTGAEFRFIGNVVDNGPLYLPMDDLTTATNFKFYTPSQVTKAEVFRRKMREQMQPDLTSLYGHAPRAIGRGADFTSTPQNEILALQLLRQMVSPEQFKRYLKYGFVTAVGATGFSYQINRNSHNIQVRDKGEVIASLCVYLQDGSIPPTDDVIAKLLICECDEQDIWNRANVTWKTQRPRVQIGDMMVA